MNEVRVIGLSLLVVSWVWGERVGGGYLFFCHFDNSGLLPAQK